MNNLKSFPYIKWYTSIGVANGPRPKSVGVKVTIKETKDVNLSKSGVLAYF